jgi:hypothetical protein
LNSKNWKLHHEMREICTEIHVGKSIHSCCCIVLVTDEFICFFNDKYTINNNQIFVQDR